MNKYRNKPIQVDMYAFDSIAESRRYKELKLLERAKEITDLELQPKFLLQEGFKKNSKTYRPIYYVADFKYKEKGKTIVEDVKSNFTAKDKVYAIKKKLFFKKYPDLEFIEVIK